MTEAVKDLLLNVTYVLVYFFFCALVTSLPSEICLLHELTPPQHNTPHLTCKLCMCITSDMRLSLSAAAWMDIVVLESSTLTLGSYMCFNN